MQVRWNADRMPDTVHVRTSVRENARKNTTMSGRTLDEISDRMPDGNGMSWVMSARMSIQVPERMSDKT